VTGDPLDNPGWAALTTEHAALAEVEGPARRYPADVSFWAAIDAFTPAAWDGLHRLVGDGGTAVLARVAFADPPPGWQHADLGTGLQMVLADPAPLAAAATRLGGDEGRSGPAVGDGTGGVTIRRLGADDVPAMTALIELTKPGPFYRRTIEMGTYLGAHDATGRLVAVAGERLHLGGHTEISAVCTHPDARGRGLASRLTVALATDIVERGETPILHVTDGNPARGMYERLGFRVRTTLRFTAFDAPGGEPTPGSTDSGPDAAAEPAPVAATATTAETETAAGRRRPER
jgi:ribosomal protein S18 acetylase RimI-like enzyme